MNRRVLSWKLERQRAPIQLGNGPLLAPVNTGTVASVTEDIPEVTDYRPGEPQVDREKRADLFQCFLEGGAITRAVVLRLAAALDPDLFVMLNSDVCCENVAPRSIMRFSHTTFEEWRRNFHFDLNFLALSDHILQEAQRRGARPVDERTEDLFLISNTLPTLVIAAPVVLSFADYDDLISKFSGPSWEWFDRWVIDGIDSQLFVPCPTSKVNRIPLNDIHGYTLNTHTEEIPRYRLRARKSALPKFGNVERLTWAATESSLPLLLRSLALRALRHRFVDAYLHLVGTSFHSRDLRSAIERAETEGSTASLESAANQGEMSTIAA